MNQPESENTFCLSCPAFAAVSAKKAAAIPSDVLEPVLFPRKKLHPVQFSDDDSNCFCSTLPFTADTGRLLLRADHFPQIESVESFAGIPVHKHNLDIIFVDWNLKN